MKRTILMLLAATAATPALAQSDPLAPIVTTPPVVVPDVPLAPPVIVRPVPKDWRGVFAAIRAEEWAGVEAGIATLPDGLLKPVAKAEYYTAKTGPRTELGPILALLAEAPDLPQAEQLQRLAMLRGAIEPPAIVVPRPTIGLPTAPRRG